MIQLQVYYYQVMKIALKPVSNIAVQNKAWLGPSNEERDYVEYLVINHHYRALCEVLINL